jgi:ribosome-associated protein
MSKSSPKRVAARPVVPAQVAEAVRAAAGKKATDIVVLDIRKAAGFTDYFVICTGQSTRQIRAIADAVEDGLAREHVKPAHVEGYQRAGWILLDYFDFVVHVFTEQTRAFYGLERLWGNASTVDLHTILPPEPARR